MIGIYSKSVRSMALAANFDNINLILVERQNVFEFVRNTFWNLLALKRTGDTVCLINILKLF